MALSIGAISSPPVAVVAAAPVNPPAPVQVDPSQSPSDTALFGAIGLGTHVNTTS